MISEHCQTLKRVTLRFGNTPDMVEISLKPIIISGSWMPMMTHVHSTRIFVVELLNIESNSLCYYDALLVRDLINDITISCSISLPTSITFTHSKICHPRDLVTRCSFMDVMSPSGPRVSLHHTEEQIPLLTHRCSTCPSKYLKTPLWSPFHRVTFDAIKALSGDSDWYGLMV